jgi:FkbM family methyltransferase
VIKIPRALYKRMGVLHLGRRRVQDFVDFIEDRRIDLVIDVGANVGQFGESLRAGGYRGRILSFEPIAAASEALSHKAAADANWEVHRCGLGAASGTATLHVSRLSVFSSVLNLAGAASLHDERMAVEHQEEITLRTLDEVVAGRSGRMLLKIDTQGYERQVLEGARQTLPQLLGIMMELPVIRVYEGQWRFHEALEHLHGLGFVPAQIEPVGYHGADKVSAIEFDCLFRPLSSLDGPGGERNAGAEPKSACFEAVEQ